MSVHEFGCAQGQPFLVVDEVIVAAPIPLPAVVAVAVVVPVRPVGVSAVLTASDALVLTLDHGWPARDMSR